MPNAEAIARLLGLLRTGEQSAEVAFRRMSASPAVEGTVRTTLLSIAADEARHDRLLATGSAATGVAAIPPERAVRRFFARLQSRELGTHLARVAGLDACVCQVLACVVGAGGGLPGPLAIALHTIRQDEGRHVRLARELARRVGTSEATMSELELDTRRAFAQVVTTFDDAFEALGVDVETLGRRIRRDGR